MYIVNYIEQKTLVLMSFRILKLASKQSRKCQLYHPFCHIKEYLPHFLECHYRYWKYYCSI